MTSEVFWTIFPYWLKAFLLTLAIEIPLFTVIGRKLIARTTVKISIPRLALAGGVGTCLTHPLLWFVWPRLISNYLVYIITGELLVAVIESFTFYAVARPIELKHAFITSFAANASSYGIGLIISLLMR